MTLVASLIGLLVLGVLLFGLVVGAVLVVGSVRRRREWSVPSGPIASTGPEGERQDPQYADRGASSDDTSDAADTAIAVVGTGIVPFTNRAPLSVPRSERSQRHG